MSDPRAYVQEQLALIVGHPVTLDEPHIRQCWAALTRQEERIGPHDLHGNWLPPGTFDETDLPLHNMLREVTGGVPASCWPAGYRFAACLTHDVDRIVQWPWRERFRQWRQLRPATAPAQQARWLAGGTLFAVRAAMGLSDTAPYDCWMTEEARYDFRSTFFILPERLALPTSSDHYYRYRDPVRYQGARMAFAEATRRASEAGWEIGLHGSYASAYHAEILADERQQVETIAGAPVIAVRQHFLRFDAHETPRAQATAGLRADSTLGFNTIIGCRNGLAFPYFWADAPDMLEVPLAIQDVGLLRDRHTTEAMESATARARYLITRIAEAGGVVTLSWHTHPQVPGALACYRHLLQVIAELGGWGCTLGELDAWWRERRQRLRATPQATRRVKQGG
jgi:hypothetical protein